MRRPRAAGRSRGRSGPRPRTRATGCAPATALRPGGLTCRRRSAARRRPRARREPARRRERVEEREPERRLDRRGAEVVLDPLEDRGERRPAGAACGGRAARRRGRRRPRAPGSGRGGAADLEALGVASAGEVARVERGLALLAAAELVAADRAAVVLADRARTAAVDEAVVVGWARRSPGQLVEDDRPVAGRAAAGVRSAIDALRLDSRRADARAPGRGVEVAQVRRAQHDLREQPVERPSSRG